MNLDHLISPVTVARATARVFGLDVDALTSGCKRQHVVHARHLGMYVCRIRFGHSFPRIGRAFNRDHTTVISGVASAGRRLTTYDRERISEITDLVERRAKELQRQSLDHASGGA